jgi:hypothetical protein
VAEAGSLENCYTRKGIVGSNPTLSAIVNLLRWVALPLSLWLFWDAVAFALIPRHIYAPF